jgi:ankyrin repeat protein
VRELPSRPNLQNPKAWLYVEKGPNPHHRLLPSLLRSGRIALNTADHNGNTALHWIVSQPGTAESALIIEALVKQGVNINAQNVWNQTALHIAVIAERNPMI